jgi:hypothetical protein
MRWWGAVVGGTMLVARCAHACLPITAGPGTAWPATGAVKVPTQTSILLTIESTPRVKLFADGALLGTTVEAAGAIATVGTHGPVYRVVPEGETLAPATEYVLTLEDGVELTRFVTVAVEEPAPAPSAPSVTDLGLWRVRYDAGQANPSCVHDAEHSFVDFSLTPATFPGTPPEEVIYTLELTSSAGTSTYRSIGELFPRAVPDPETNYGPPAGWNPALVAGETACLTVAAVGYGDLAGEPSRSAPVCARVELIDLDAGGCRIGVRGDQGPEAVLLLFLGFLAFAQRAARIAGKASEQPR